MGRSQEFIGVREEAISCDIKGNPIYNMYLTDTKVIRCRDCKHHVTSDTKSFCKRFHVSYRENGCVRWRKPGPTLEQRYQQLEQVAKELYMRLLPGCGKARYREKLEALGIEV